MSDLSSNDPAPISEGLTQHGPRFDGARNAAIRVWHQLTGRPVVTVFGVLLVGMAIVWTVLPTGRAPRISAALAAESQLYREMEATVTPLDSHWDASGAAARYAEGVSRIDTSACPADFQLAFLRYVQAWNAVVREKRSNSWAGLIIRGFLFGKDKGSGLGETDEAVKRAQQEWFEVERLAVKYGATRSR